MAIIAAIALAAALAAQAPTGSGGAEVVPQARQASFTELDRAEAIARYGHPNEMWRYRALRALKLEQPRRAADDFRRASHYGDKFSQHALSLLYWHGVGVARDRAQAYAWSDLAAERGYHDLLLVREKMWSQLDPAQRARALSLGDQAYRDYGDAVAQPRMEWEMRKALASITGSRVGASKDRVEFMNHGAIEDAGVAPRAFFAEKRWRANAYWREQDRQWKARVIVLPPESVPDPLPSP